MTVQAEPVLPQRLSVHVLQDRDVTTELHATTVGALMEHLQLQDVILVMHDWGGETGYQVSHMHHPRP